MGWALAVQIKTKNLHSVALSDDGAWLATGARDATVRVWNAHTGKIHWRCKLPGRGGVTWVEQPTFSADGRYLALWSRHLGHLLDVASKQVVSTGPVEGYGAGVAFSQGALALGGSQLEVRDLGSGRVRRLAPVRPATHFTRVAFSPDGGAVAAMGTCRDPGPPRDTLQIFDLGRASTGIAVDVPDACATPDTPYGRQANPPKLWWGDAGIVVARNDQWGAGKPPRSGVCVFGPDGEPGDVHRWPDRMHVVFPYAGGVLGATAGWQLLHMDPATGRIETYVDAMTALPAQLRGTLCASQDDATIAVIDGWRTGVDVFRRA